MTKKAATLGLVMALLVSTMFAGEGAVPRGVPHLDHVFVIMMENHATNQIIGKYGRRSLYQPVGAQV